MNNNYDIDVHIITYNEPKWKIDRCLESLKNEPINIHIVDGFCEWPPNRINAFSKGKAPFISYVDPDDYVESGCFSEKVPFLTEDFKCIYSYEYQHFPTRTDIGKSMHHAFILPRGLFSDDVFSN